MKKHALRFIAMLLVLVMALHDVSYCFAENGEAVADTVYVSEVKTFHSVEECEKAGYTYAECDLNDNSKDTDSTMNGANPACYLGYKTTTDKSKAITDLKMLQMGIGYRTDYNYGELLAEKMDLASAASNLLNAAVYFTDHYEKSPLGRAACKVLNYYYVPGDYTRSGEDIPFGDFVLSDECDENFIKSYLVRLSATGVTLLVAQLAAGVADSDTYDTWATRVEEGESVCLLDSENEPSGMEKKSYDKLYQNIAEKISEQVVSYAKVTAKAITYLETHGSFDDTALSQAAKQGKEALAAYEDQAYEEGVKEEDNYDLYYNLYLKLNAYPVTDNLKLGDYIVSLAELKLDESNRTETVKELRRLYPLAEAMTVEQAIMTMYAGFPTMIAYLENTEEKEKECEIETEKKMGELLELIIEDQLSNDAKYRNKSEAEKKVLRSRLKKTQKISIYDGMEHDFYNDKVCVTDELIRANVAGGNMEEYLDRSNEKSLERTRKELIANLHLAGVFLVDLTIGLTIQLFTLFGVEIAGFFAFYSSYITLPVMIITMLAMFFISMFTSRAALKDWEEVQTSETDIEKTPIPEQIYSIEHPTVIVNGEKTQTTKIIEYTAVQNGYSGEAEDMNRSTGKRWNALYHAEGSVAGSPLVVPEDRNPFMVQSGSTSTPAGYTPLTVMGSTSAANINSYTKSKSLYLFYCTEDSLTETDTNDANEGTEVIAKSYLSGIMLAYSNNDTTARAKITDKGYTLIDSNLTPRQYYALDKDNTKVYTYIGIKTTTDKNAAITDIRVANSFADQQISYGSATYVNAGTTVGGDSLIYTMSATAGSPIVGDMYVYDKISSAPAGYEPVNLLSGGPAFNFSRSATTAGYYQSSFTIDGFASKYLFFRPSFMYTEGTKYISGLFALRSCYESGDFGSMSMKDQFRTYLGDSSITILTKLPDDFTCYYSDYTSPIIRIDGYSTYGALAYTTTYNPYRAIYDIKVFQGSNTAASLLPSLSNANGAYAACESYGLGRVNFSTGWYQDWMEAWGFETYDFWEKIRTTILPFHSISKTVGPNLNKEENYDYTYLDLVRAQLCEKNTNADYVTNCLKGLYVLGNTKTDINNAHPIRVDQLVATQNKNGPGSMWDFTNSYKPVVNFMTPNASEPMAINNMVSKDFKDGSYQQRDNSENGWHYETRKDCSYLNEEGAYYLFIKLSSGDKLDIQTGDRERYISAITVGGSKLTDSSQKAYNDDIARAGALAGSSDEILYNNIAVKNSEIWYLNGSKKNLNITYRESGDVKYTFEGKTCTTMNYVDRASYIGISRTNDTNSAIYDIVKVKLSDTAKIPSTLKINNMTYISANGVVYDRNGAYTYYYTRNRGAGNGSPITELSIENKPLISGKLGFACMKLDSDGKTLTETDITSSNGKYIVATCQTELGGSGDHWAYTSVGIGAGTTDAQAMNDVMLKGYQTFINADLNYNSLTGFVYMGYERQSYESLVAAGDEDLAITDIIFTVGKAYRPTLEINGITYTGDPTSLNAYTNGAAVYMYYTRDPKVYTEKDGSESNGINVITDIRFYVGDWIPSPEEGRNWETVLDPDTGKRANLNQDVWCSAYDDSRLFMFVSRLDNSTKPDTVPTGYYGNTKFYSLYTYSF